MRTEATMRTNVWVPRNASVRAAGTFALAVATISFGACREHGRVSDRAASGDAAVQKADDAARTHQGSRDGADRSAIGIGPTAARPHPADPSFDEDEERPQPQRWVQGRLGRMRATALRTPQYDKGYGATTIEFVARPGGGADDKVVQESGVWKVICYVDELQAFLLGGIFQRGAWLPMTGLIFVDERTGVRRESHVNVTRWMAMAAVPGPRGRYVAFIADAGDAFDLQILDPLTDSLFRVGRPPAPPPMKKDDWDLCMNDLADRTFTWGDMADGFTEMDRGIIQFPDGKTLAVSYGTDTCKRRSRQRQVRKWNLPGLLARQPKVVPLPDE